MYVLPLIEVQGGESAHLFAGPSEGEARPLIDPVEVMQRFQRSGAQGLHVVDLDRALENGKDNDSVLVRMVDRTRLAIQTGGGVQSLTRIQELLDTGARRVLVGTMGVLHPRWLGEAATIFGDRLVACVDIEGTHLRIKGRTATAPAALDDHLAILDAMEVGTIHVSLLEGGPLAVPAVAELARRLKTPISCQGAATSSEDLAKLEQAGVSGVVLGAETYQGRIDFHDVAKQYRTL